MKINASGAGVAVHCGCGHDEVRTATANGWYEQQGILLADCSNLGEVPPIPLYTDHRRAIGTSVE